MPETKDLIIKLDNKLIDVFDAGTTYIQRQGIIPLNTLIMATEVLFWTSAIVLNKGSLFMWVLVVLGAITLFMSFLRWQHAVGYWENYRKMMQLNANVVSNRDSHLFRIFNLFMMSFFSVMAILSQDWSGLLGPITLTCMFYLGCCLYLGPGDYAKNRKPNLSTRDLINNAG